MAAQLFRLPMPEGGAEHNVLWFVHHQCPQARALIPVMEDGDLDLLLFPVGNVGYGMPANIPFDVESQVACGACGAQPRAWFEWTAPKLFVPK